MTQPTVTLPREVVEDLFRYYVHETHRNMRDCLHAALDAPAKPVDCRGCMNVMVSFDFDQSAFAIYETSQLCNGCTDFDKFQALPPVVLTKVTK